MAELAYSHLAIPLGGPSKKSISQHVVECAQLLPPLLMAALLADLFTPFLIWKRFLPGASKWLGDLFIFMMIGHTFWQMLRRDRIPTGFLLIVAISIVGGVVSLFEGQQWQATAWGIWLMFKYPMAAIYAALHTKWSKHFPKYLFYGLMGLLVFQTVFQVGQYILGQIPGDDLAGSFGWHGVAPLLMLLALILCIAFGHWLATGEWSALGIAIVFGGLSSILGEMKIFPIIILAIAAISICILIVRNGKIGQAFAILVILSIAAPIFVFLYNSLASDVAGTRRLDEYFNVETTEKYLQNTDLLPTGIYYFGRGFAMQYAWDAIQRDGTTLVAGYGIGARADSQSLGILGQALIQSDYGRTTPGTSMLILLQEAGVGGLAVLGIFTLFFISTLYTDMARNQDRYLSTLRYGFLLFSALWPLWLWYTSSWHYSVTMILYWAGVGYLLCHREPKPIQSQDDLGWVTVPSTVSGEI